MPQEKRAQRLAQAANRWDMAPEELKAFVEMAASAPWARVQGFLQGERKSAEKALQTEDNMTAIARAQGKLEAARRVERQIQDIVESYKEAMRDED